VPRGCSCQFVSFFDGVRRGLKQNKMRRALSGEVRALEGARRALSVAVAAWWEGEGAAAVSGLAQAGVVCDTARPEIRMLGRGAR
jgi:hypothetical protein